MERDALAAQIAHLSVLHPARSRGLVTLMGYNFEQSIDVRPRDLPRALRTFEATHVSLQRFHDTRQGEGLAKISAFAWFDCEITEASPFFGMPPEEIAGILLSRFDENGVPRPSHITFSGRGIWGVWQPERPLPASAQRRVKRALHHFWGGSLKSGRGSRDEAVQAKADRLKAMWDGMDLDMAVGDMPRVYRLAGTRNEKSGETVRLVWPSSWAEVERQDFEVFADAVMPFSRMETEAYLAECNANRAALAAQAAAEGRTQQAPRVTNHGTGFYGAIADELLKVAAHLGPQGLKDGRIRGRIAHHIASAWAYSGAGGDAEEWAAKLAPYCVGYKLTEANLRAYLRPVEKRLRRAEAGETSTWGDGTRSTVYGYSTARIIDEIGITQALARELGLVRLMPTGGDYRPMTPAERAAKARAARGCQTKAELARLDQVMAQTCWKMALEGLNVTETAQVLGITRATVRRYIDIIELDVSIEYTGPVTETEIAPLAAAIDDTSTDEVVTPRHATLGVVLPASAAPTLPPAKAPNRRLSAKAEARKALERTARLALLTEHFLVADLSSRQYIEWHRVDVQQLEAAQAEALRTLQWEVEDGCRHIVQPYRNAEVRAAMANPRPAPCGSRPRVLH
ncbi:hypothetical protein ASF49_08160 [Methylobacterium sp. Leaf104]|uniref:hypothetical protein n=1 Tax=Methylobacterium TaxID=407 RepID=UPI0007012387|nr:MULTISPECIES: hypothetical protein [Methylobacterium]KQP33831.1 hypothetical protein ASF49_08160 [Methylobacterium sp. Leaf104]MCI9879601.1 hypothetical protein [Methylobacterium goesingense]